MTEAADRYRDRAKIFDAKVEAVPVEAWKNQSPCPDWDALGVLRHVIETSEHFLGWVDVSGYGRPEVDDDPKAAWRAMRTEMERCLADEAIAGRIVEREFGTDRFDFFVGHFLAIDLIVHAWDIAKAVGIDTSLDEVQVRSCRLQAEPMVEMGRKMGAFGPEVEVSESASEQDRLLAMLGRNP